MPMVHLYMTNAGRSVFLLVKQPNSELYCYMDNCCVARGHLHGSRKLIRRGAGFDWYSPMASV